MNSKTSKKVAAALAAGAVTVAGSGIAFAYWTSNGSGDGSASATAGVSDIADLVSGGLTTELFPGQDAQDVTFTVHNPASNAQSIYITTVKGYLTVTKANGVTAACDTSDFKLEGTASTDVDHPVVLADWTAQELASDASDTGVTTLQFRDKADTNQDGCKGASVAIHYVAS